MAKHLNYRADKLRRRIAMEGRADVYERIVAGTHPPARAIPNPTPAHRPAQERVSPLASQIEQARRQVCSDAQFIINTIGNPNNTTASTKPLANLRRSVAQLQALEREAEIQRWRR